MITVSVAALVAAGGVAFAQDVDGPRDKPAVAAPAHAATPVENSKTDRLKVETHKTDEVKPAPAAQLPAKAAGTKPETSGQGNGMQPAQRDAKADAKHGVPVALSTEQHAKVWETLRGEKQARFTGEKFSMTVGAIVPQTVRLNRLPAGVIEYAPQYRGYEYILVGEEILIVDPGTHRIVAVVVA
jgi:hypothetical protein